MTLTQAKYLATLTTTQTLSNGVRLVAGGTMDGAHHQPNALTYALTGDGELLFHDKARRLYGVIDDPSGWFWKSFLYALNIGFEPDLRTHLERAIRGAYLDDAFTYNAAAGCL